MRVGTLVLLVVGFGCGPTVQGEDGSTQGSSSTEASGSGASTGGSEMMCADFVPPPIACPSTGPSRYRVALDPPLPDPETYECIATEVDTTTGVSQRISLDCGTGAPVTLTVESSDPWTPIFVGADDRLIVTYDEFVVSMDAGVERVLTVRDEADLLVLAEADVTSLDALDFSPLQLGQVATGCPGRAAPSASCLEGGAAWVQNQLISATFLDRTAEIPQGSTEFVGAFSSYAVTVAESVALACADPDCASTGASTRIRLAAVYVPEG